MSGLFPDPPSCGPHPDTLLPPSSHGRGPATEHLAEQQATESGQRQANLDVVMAVVRENPGLTSGEISIRCSGKIDTTELLTECRRRLNDALNLGLVEHKNARKCRALGTMQLEWWAQ